MIDRKIGKARLLLLAILFVITLPISTPAQKTSPSAKNEKVLDFDAEVIEGQRKAPQLFLQMDVGTPDLDAVMYLRQNFNDFQAVEQNRRPLYRRAGK